jgi:type I restriction enzyme S subunit
MKTLFEIRKRIVGEEGYDVLSVTQKGLRIKDIESNEGQLSMDYSKYQLVEPGDFVMNHMDLLTGWVDIATVSGVTSPDYRVFSTRTPSLVHDTYFLYVFQNSYKQKVFYTLGQGASQLGRWRLPSEQFYDFILPFPPRQEQVAIGSFLDRETRKIDALLEEQQALIELLNEKVTAVVLSSIRSPETKELRLENAATVIARLVDQRAGELYKPIGIFNRGRGLFHKDPREVDDMGDSDFYWIEEGDLIISGQFAWEGAVALAGKDEAACVVSHRYPVLRGKPGIALTEYLLALLLTEHGDFLLNENSRGAAGRNRPLNINSLLKEKVPIPDMQTQEKVAQAVHRRSKLLSEMSSQVGLLKERRDALVSAAVSGQIDVRKYRPQEAAALCP